MTDKSKKNQNHYTASNAIANPDLGQQIASMLYQGFELLQCGQFEKAQPIFKSILEIDPKNFDSLQLLAFISIQTNQWNSAFDFYARALEIDPNNPLVLSNQGVVLYELKRFEDALLIYDRSIELKQDSAEAYSNRGNVLQELNRLEDALLSYEKAILFRSDYAEAHYNRGKVLKELKRFEEALISYEKAILLKNDYADAHSNLGNVLQEIERPKEALLSYDRALEIKRDSAETHFNRGNVLQQLMRWDEALQSYDHAIIIRRDYAEAYSNRGNVLKELKKLNEALLSYDNAIKCKPDYAEAYCNRGNLFKENGCVDEALASYDKAIEFKPDSAEIYANRGTVLKELKRMDEAIYCFQKGLEIKPHYEYLFGAFLHAKMLICNWHNLEDEVAKLASNIRNNKKSSYTFPLLALIDNLKIHKVSSEMWVSDKYPTNRILGAIPKHTNKSKISIGYYSADFREHPVSYLAAELFEMHDKSKFEIYAFYWGAAENSPMQQRVSAAFDKFIDVRLKTDKEIASLSRQMGIDVAVDLTGNTADGRLGIFACRAAPVQLSYIGYLGTMGASYYDYLIADKTIIPTESQKYYVEKIVYLPCYQVNDSKRSISDKSFQRKDLNLPDAGFVFCCFNNNYKITPKTFDGWMRILCAVPGSVLLLYSENKWAKENLISEAVKRGVDKKRLVFAGALLREEYLARYRIADLFLDTLPYNAGTTASDALWAGLPVLTCAGESFASRVASSLLNAIGIPELITTTQSEYEAMAIKLALNPGLLKSIKEKLAINRSNYPLFNTPLFTKNIEDAYTKMYGRYLLGYSPEHIYFLS